MNNINQSYEKRYNSLYEIGAIDYHTDRIEEQLPELQMNLNQFPSRNDRQRCMEALPSIIFGLAILAPVENYKYKNNISILSFKLQSLALNAIPIMIIICITCCLLYQEVSYTLRRERAEARLESAREKLLNLSSSYLTIHQIETNRGSMPAQSTDAEILHFAMTGQVKGTNKVV